MIILYTLVYLVTEFIFQTDSMRDGKKDFSKFKEVHLYHLLITAGLNLLLTIILLVMNIITIKEAVISFVLVVLIRLVIDCAKTGIKMILDKKGINYNTVLYLVEQILHLTLLSFVASMFRRITFYSEIYYIAGLLIFTILITKGIGCFIQNFIKDLKICKTSNIDKTGRVIGYLERLIIAIAIFNAHYELIVLVLGFKTLYRFKEKDPTIDYYIMGSLLSLLSTVVVCNSLLILDSFYV